jgi:hypothetical protein
MPTNWLMRPNLLTALATALAAPPRPAARLHGSPPARFAARRARTRHAEPHRPQHTKRYYHVTARRRRIIRGSRRRNRS